MEPASSLNVVFDYLYGGKQLYGCNLDAVI